MILNFSMNFNTFSEVSLQAAYDNYINQHQTSFQCPNPECSHSDILLKSMSYNRYLYCDIDTLITIRIAVMRCHTCGTYHAILPACILPFSSYSYPFIIKTLHTFYDGEYKGNKTKVCEFMHISRKTLNHFISMISKEDTRTLHKKMALHNVKKIIIQIQNKRFNLYSFLSSYLKSNQLIFLLSTNKRHFLFIAFTHRIKRTSDTSGHLR